MLGGIWGVETGPVVREGGLVGGRNEDKALLCTGREKRGQNYPATPARGERMGMQLTGELSHSDGARA